MQLGIRCAAPVRYKHWQCGVMLFFILIAICFSPPVLGAPSKTLLRNAALILTMDPRVGTGDLGVIQGADILLDGDKIASVGKNLPGRGAQIVDAAGKIVMPGFVDVHTHLWQSLIRDSDVAHKPSRFGPISLFPGSQSEECD